MNNMTAATTPLMKQYVQIKEQYPDMLVMFQVGDFYELFFDDAKKAAAFLGITLTKRGKILTEDIPLCGVPVHALDYYVAKLVKGGFRIAICNQLEEPKPGKVVLRGVTQVLTPGTLTDDQLLETKSASYLLSVMPCQNHLGLLFSELLTAQLYATVIPLDQLSAFEGELTKFLPDEVIFPIKEEIKTLINHISKIGFCTTTHQWDQADLAQTDDWIAKQFKAEVQSVVQGQAPIYHALSLFHSYLKKNQESALDQFRHVYFYRPDDFLMLDRSTQRHLELVKNNQDNTVKNSLFQIVDGATTAMGSRLIKKWITRPLVKKEAIVQRQEVIELLITRKSSAHSLRNLFLEIGDLERIVGRIALGRGSLHDYLGLKNALNCLPAVHHELALLGSAPLLQIIAASISQFQHVRQLLEASLNDDTGKDWIIKRGFDQQLDYIRELVEKGNERMVALEQQEQKATGINSLKVRYNQIHGYYIEITKTHLDSVPPHYIRHQTLIGKERYTTLELKELEQEISLARQEIDQIEQTVFTRIKNEIAGQCSHLRKTTQSLAHIDGLLGFALIASERGYTKPLLHDGQDIIIQEGRHPVVSRFSEHDFIANDTYLTDEQSTWIITGPNMGGKSTYLRQVALLSIMAQCGSFIPAKYAKLPLLDRIFTRIGASDNLSEGKSTFLVEMEETALICKMATKKSLLILDEVGRGTSTFDGLALARSIVEYIHETIGARCLFATHYHELTQLHNHYPHIVNYQAASKKSGERMLLLYKIIAGVADGSFGIEVARMAHLPEQVIQRSQELIKELKSGENKLTISHENSSDQLSALQTKLNSSHYQNELIKTELMNINWDELSPKKAFDLLWQLKERVQYNFQHVERVENQKMHSDFSD